MAKKESGPEKFSKTPTKTSRRLAQSREQLSETEPSRNLAGYHKHGKHSFGRLYKSISTDFGDDSTLFYSAIEEAMSLENWADRKKGLILALISCEDANLALRAIKDFKIDMQSLSNVTKGFPDVLLSRIVEQNGFESAIKWNEENYTGAQKFKQVAVVFNGLAFQDLEKAKREYTGFSSYAKEQYFMPLFEGALSQGWDEATSTLVEFNDYSDASVYSKLSFLASDWEKDKLAEVLEEFPSELDASHFVKQLALSKVNEDFEYSLELLGFMEENRRDATEVALLSKHSFKDPQKIGDLLLRDERPELFGKVITPLMRSFLHNAPDNGITFLMALDQPKREELIPKFVGSWFHRDPNEVVEWLRTREQSGLNDLVLASISIQAEKDSSGSGYLWAQEITDEQMRANVSDALKNK